MKLSNIANFLWRALPRKLADLKARNGQKSPNYGLILIDSTVAGSRRRAPPAGIIITSRKLEIKPKTLKIPMKKYKMNHFSNLHLEAAETEAGKNVEISISVSLCSYSRLCPYSDP